MARSGDARDHWLVRWRGLAEMAMWAEPSPGTPWEGTQGGSVAALQCWELGGPSAPAVFNQWIHRLQPAGLLLTT